MSMLEPPITPASPASHSTPKSNPKDGLRQVGLTLMHNSSTQVGGMVTSVILVGQAVAKFSEGASLYAAFLFSCLLAIYQVVVVEKASAREYLVTVPISALVLFALALGGNNSLDLVAGADPLKKELKLVEEKLQSQIRQLENTTQLIHQLEQLLGSPLPSPPTAEESSKQSLNKPGEVAQAQTRLGWFDFLFRPAHAQPSDGPPPAARELERQKALEVLRAYEARQQALQQEQQRLQEKLKLLQEEQQERQQSAPVWRKW